MPFFAGQANENGGRCRPPDPSQDAERTVRLSIVGDIDVTSTCWRINGLDHALCLTLDERGRIDAGVLLRKRDEAVLARLRGLAGAPVPTTRLRRSDSMALSRLWALRPGRTRRRPPAPDAGRQRRHVQRRLAELGIRAASLSDYPVPACNEPGLLVLAGADRYGRDLWLEPAAARAWRRMRAAASRQGIALEAVSGYRSIDYQAGLIARKLARGQRLTEILAVSALPGHSEHHLGTVLDLHSGDGPVLEEAFEDTPGFAWLDDNARRFGFHLSYPRDNPWGIAYEPWHWRHHPCRTVALPVV